MIQSKSLRKACQLKTHFKKKFEIFKEKSLNKIQIFEILN